MADDGQSDSTAVRPSPETVLAKIKRLWAAFKDPATPDGSAILRLFGLLGSALTFLGALVSLISGALLSQHLHSQYLPEHAFLLVLAIAAIVSVWYNRLRTLGYIGWIIAFVMLTCVSTETWYALANLRPHALSVSGLDLFKTGLRESVEQLWWSHFGWSFLLFAFFIFIYVGGRSSSYRFYEEMQRRRAFREGHVISKRDEILSEIFNAPVWPLASGTILILTGIVVLFAGGEVSLGRKLIGALVSELGFAFFIAYVLSISLEVHAKRQHDRQVSRSLLSVVYGTNLDKTLFSDTETYIFKSAFYRRDVIVEYDFLKVSGEWMLLKYVLSYTVENISSGSASYPVEAHVEKIEDQNDLLDQGMKFGLQHIYVEGKPISDDQMSKARANVPDDDKYIKSRHMVPLKPGERKAIRTVHITARMTRDSELWRSLIPCSSLTLKVRWSKDIDLEVKAEPVHPCGDFKFEELDRRSFFATIDRPLFPHNGVQLWWKPIRPKSGETTQGGGDPGADRIERPAQSRSATSRRKPASVGGRNLQTGEKADTNAA